MPYYLSFYSRPRPPKKAKDPAHFRRAPRKVPTPKVIVINAAPWPTTSTSTTPAPSPRTTSKTVFDTALTFLSPWSKHDFNEVRNSFKFFLRISTYWKRYVGTLKTAPFHKIFNLISCADTTKKSQAVLQVIIKIASNFPKRHTSARAVSTNSAVSNFSHISSKEK